MKRYQLHNLGPFWAKPYCIMLNTGRGFWQQVSPHYLYEKSARNWAKRNNLTLEN